MKKVIDVILNMLGVSSIGMFLFGLLTFTQINANMDLKFLLVIMVLWVLSVIYLFWSLNNE